MKTFRVKVVLVVIAVVGAIVTLSVGTAAAKDPYVGQTYAEASSKIADRGGVPVAATVVGDQLAKDDCIVTAWRKATYVQDNFNHGKDFLLSLNCSAKLANAGESGNSLASPQGAAEAKVEKTARRYNNKPEICANDLERCQKFCDKNVGSCSKEVLALF